MIELGKCNIAVIGLGYVGLPLAIEFGKYFPVVGFDINLERIAELKSGVDATREVTRSEFKSASLLNFSSEIDAIENCNIFIVTVPTPIDDQKRPNLSPLLEASKMLGLIIKQGDIVIYESTVYPGATEEKCVPVLSEVSGLTFNEDFFVGYSPERINPGDMTRRLPDIMKVTSGSTDRIADYINDLYRTIIIAGTHKASSIRVAEAAKVIENTQRDLNIALINELSILFNKLDIDTESVLKAAETKWNFLPFRPGLVGGHCIGVDPYYLTHKAQSIGYSPDIILAGRNLNDTMGSYVAGQMAQALDIKGHQLQSSKVLILGFTFKENCPDIRNTKVIDIYTKLLESGIDVDIYDPLINESEAFNEYGIRVKDNLEQDCYDGIILAVAHKNFVDMGIEKIKLLGKADCLVYDLKYIFDSNDTDLRL